MESIELKAYAKINWAIDVLRKLPNGYHEISTVMQLIQLHDQVQISWTTNKDSTAQIQIELVCSGSHLPENEQNLAYQAAMTMIQQFGAQDRFGGGTLSIVIKKNIPVGAGLAGGSADAAAVLLAISKLWELDLDLFRLCQLGAQLGADVPFCIMGQAKANRDENGFAFGDLSRASTCALAEGIGTSLTPIKGMDCRLVLSKPSMSISTASIYAGYDEIAEKITARPCMDQLVSDIKEKKFTQVSKNMTNVLEKYAIKAYPDIAYTKSKMETKTRALQVLMSGSGPTIFAPYQNEEDAQEAFEMMSRVNDETFLTRTIV